MTLETLKSNRDEIISIITEKVGNEKVKEVMALMVNMIGFRGYEGYSVAEFTLATIKDNDVKPYEKPFTPTWMIKGFDSQQAYSFFLQRGSSMR
jgi:hypothetical protein